MKIVVLGAGNVGRAVVEALHSEHEMTVVDVDDARLTPLADRYDVRTVEGNGTTKRVMREAGIQHADLLIACSPREEANLVCAMLARKLSNARVIVRTSSVEYLEAWREREIDVDFMVSSELETGIAVSEPDRHPRRPADRRVRRRQGPDRRVRHPGGREHRPADRPPAARGGDPDDSKVVAIIRGDQLILPRGSEAIERGDRIVVIASPVGARMEPPDRARRPGSRRARRVRRRPDGLDDRARAAHRDVRVRLVDSDHRRATEAAEALPEARVFCAHAFDPEFFERERIGRAQAAVFCLNDDAKNLYAAVLARVHGVRLTVALAHDPAAVSVYESGGGRRDQPAPGGRGGVRALRPRPAHPPDRHARGRPLRDPRPDGPPGVRARRQEFDDLPQTGSVIGALIGTAGDLPARLRLAAGRRPGDHLRGVAPRGAGREGALITGVDVGSALDLIGGVLKWVGATFVVLAAVALGYGEPAWPFLVAGAVTVGAGLLLDQITGRRPAPPSARARASWSSP